MGGKMHLTDEAAEAVGGGSRPVVSEPCPSVDGIPRPEAPEKTDGSGILAALRRLLEQWRTK